MAAETLVLIFLTIVIGLLLFVYRRISPPGQPGNRPSGHGSAEKRFGRRHDGRPGTGGNGAGSGTAGGGMLPCPLCGSRLAKGETVHSYVYRAGSDSLSHIFGCPYCSERAPGSAAARSAADSGTDGNGRSGGSPVRRSGTKIPQSAEQRKPPYALRPRSCPVCRRQIPAEGYLVARMFEKKVPAEHGGLKKKTHVHVLGCTECRKR